MKTLVSKLDAFKSLEINKIHAHKIFGGCTIVATARVECTNGTSTDSYGDSDEDKDPN